MFLYSCQTCRYDLFFLGGGRGLQQDDACLLVPSPESSAVNFDGKRASDDSLEPLELASEHFHKYNMYI